MQPAPKDSFVHSFIFLLCWLAPGLSLLLALFGGATFATSSGKGVIQILLAGLGILLLLSPLFITVTSAMFVSYLHITSRDGRPEKLFEKRVVKQAMSFCLLQILFAPLVAGVCVMMTIPFF